MIRRKPGRSPRRRLVFGPWPKLMRALPLAAALPAANAYAQVAPISPYVPPAPVNLDPGASPQTTAPVPPPAQPSSPVIVVGPDGSVRPAGQGAEPASSNTFVSSDSPAAPGDEPDTLRGGAVPELHVVRHGDTLWDICSLYFNDPWQWPKIWSYNPQVTNPHWIYPGDLIRLLPRGVFSSLSSAPSAPDQPAAVDRLPAPQRASNVSIKQTAFVEKSDLDRSITIVGADDEKVLLGKGDDVYLQYPQDKPPKVGDRYSIYLPGNTVKSNGAEVGAYVQVLGTVEIKSVSQDKRARGVIVESNREIERGARVGPLLKEFHPVPPVANKVDAQGNVVALLAYSQLIGQGEVLFVDLGKSSGVQVGNRMFVVRRGDAHPEIMSRQAGQDDRAFPARALGEVLIVDVGERISVGLVTLSEQEMSVGDRVVMQAAR
ncbi:MAG TPA: LysM peptidoglycan-binding domain-containing protein [Kofleriaceae bacterium]|nr:LysM peptidoglycan-binding domain-containing protein [Kofleriaceae bacterium]